MIEGIVMTNGAVHKSGLGNTVAVDVSVGSLTVRRIEFPYLGKL